MAGFADILSVGGGRARRVTALCLMAFALLLQVNAPVQATLMMIGTADGGTICSIHTADAPDRKTPPAKHAACQSCVICHAAAPTLAAADVVLHTPAVATVWVAEIVREAAPRGPPARTAQARAPPFQA